jgi:hypothetical protein
MNEHDPQLRGEHLAGKFWLYEVPSGGSPMIHVTHSYRSEIVLFGEGQKFILPVTLEAGNSIIVKSQPDGEISVARFSAHEADQRRTVSNSVAEVIRAIATVGGDYPDAVQALQEARACGALDSRFEVDALPAWSRVYDRNHKLAQAADESASGTKLAAMTAQEKHGAKTAHAEVSPSHDAGDAAPSELGAVDSLPSLFGSGAPKQGDGADEEHLDASKSEEKSSAHDPK